MHIMCMQCLKESEEGTRYFEITDGCEPPVGVGNKTQTLYKNKKYSSPSSHFSSTTEIFF